MPISQQQLDDILVTALRSGDLSRASDLIGKGANASAQRRGVPLLCSFAMDGNAPAVSFLLANGADKDFTDARGDSALTLAVGSGDLDTVRAILAESPDLEKASRSGMTALLKSALDMKPDIMGALLDAGADFRRGRVLEVLMSQRHTAVDIRMDFGNVPACARLLLAAGASPVKPGLDGVTPLHRALAHSFKGPHLEGALLMLEAAGKNASFRKPPQPSPVESLMSGHGGVAQSLRENPDGVRQVLRALVATGAPLSSYRQHREGLKNAFGLYGAILSLVPEALPQAVKQGLPVQAPGKDGVQCDLFSVVAAATVLSPPVRLDVLASQVEALRQAGVAPDACPQPGLGMGAWAVSLVNARWNKARDQLIKATSGTMDPSAIMSLSADALAVVPGTPSSDEAEEFIRRVLASGFAPDARGEVAHRAVECALAGGVELVEVAGRAGLDYDALVDGKPGWGVLADVLSAKLATHRVEALPEIARLSRAMVAACPSAFSVLDGNGNPPLVVTADSPVVAGAMLAGGADPLQPSADGQTGLSSALASGSLGTLLAQLEVVRLSGRAIPESAVFSALAACRDGGTELVKALSSDDPSLPLDAWLSYRDPETGMTVLDMASWAGQPDAVAFLLSHPASNHGFPLHFAALSESSSARDVAAYLLASGYSADQANADGYSVRDMAEEVPMAKAILSVSPKALPELSSPDGKWLESQRAIGRSVLGMADGGMPGGGSPPPPGGKGSSRKKRKG